MDDETRQTFNEYLDNHGSDIPLFYRGTCNPDFSWDDYYGQYGGMEVCGFSQIRGKLKETLSYFYRGENVKVSKFYTLSIKVVGDVKTIGGNNCYIRNGAENLIKEKGAILTSMDVSNQKTSAKALLEGKNQDGDKMVYTLSADSNSFTFQADRIDEFNPEATDSWKDGVKEARKSSLGGHVIPYLYTGSTHPTYRAEEGKIVLTGNNYDIKRIPYTRNLKPKQKAAE